MIYGSICSGIEAASVAWNPLGWRCAFTSEIEPFPCAVLKHHYPDVPNLGDLTKHETWNHEPIELLVGGTPCQSFSVAGLRQGLHDPRGNLTLTFLGLVARARPRWVVWENVPGILSDRTGAFGAFLGGLGELGYGFAYRILDAQYFGVAQRRRRVFVVAHAGGDWQRAAAVLFERESLRGDSAPRRETGQRVAGSLSARTKGSGGLGTDFDLDGGCVGVGIDGGDVGFALRAGASHSGDKGDGGLNTSLVATLTKNYATHHGRTAGNNGGVATNHTPNGHGCSGVNNQHARNGHLIPEIACALQERDSKGSDSKGSDSSTKDGHLIPESSGMAVRRLTPRECERLQGFPDDYTRIAGWSGWRDCESGEEMEENRIEGLTYRRTKSGKWKVNDPDGVRYKALGNSMAVPVMRWIGRRIELVEELTPEL